MPLTSYDFPSILPFLQATIHAGNIEKNTKNEPWKHTWAGLLPIVRGVYFGTFSQRCRKLPWTQPWRNWRQSFFFFLEFNFLNGENLASFTVNNEVKSFIYWTVPYSTHFTKCWWKKRHLGLLFINTFAAYCLLIH